MAADTVEWFSDCSVTVSTATPLELAVALKEVLRVGDERLYVRPGMDRVLVEVAQPVVGLRDLVAGVVSSLKARDGLSSSDEVLHRIPTRYDGVDLDDVAATLGMSREAVIQAHSSARWRVAMLGFAPGFPYLQSEEPGPLAGLERLSSPRAQVPPGSVAVAAGMSAVYPRALPGGWRILGTTEAVLFDPADEARPALLGPGDILVFEAVSS